MFQGRNDRIAEYFVKVLFILYKEKGMNRRGWSMYKDQLDFLKISKAIESVYEQLQEESLTEQAVNTMKEAEENLQQAISYSLSNTYIKRTY